MDGTFSFLVSTKDEIGYAKDRLAAKPMVKVENENLVAIASEEVSLNRLFPGSARHSGTCAGDIRTWRRSIQRRSPSREANRLVRAYGQRVRTSTFSNPTRAITSGLG